MIHAFSPAGFALTHHHSEHHFRTAETGNPMLNAEDFYAALLFAAQSYFAQSRPYRSCPNVGTYRRPKARRPNRRWSDRADLAANGDPLCNRNDWGEERRPTS